MDVATASASDLVDQFENLLGEHGISIPSHPITGSDMLPFWSILKRIRDGLADDPEELRGDFTAALAAHDLAAKILEVSDNPHFGQLVPHLRKLSEGTVHLTVEPPAYADTYNKLIELYWASLCLSAGIRVELDDPDNADGKNPDVMTLDGTGKPQRAYAFKTVRSPHTQNLLEHITKGIDQIEKSGSKEGIVALHLTPRINRSEIWPTGQYFTHWGIPADRVRTAFRTMLTQIVLDNGQSAVDALFAGKKAVGSVLCIAFCPTVAVHPTTNRPTMMPLKVAYLVDLAPQKAPPPDFLSELDILNRKMQTILG